VWVLQRPSSSCVVRHKYFALVWRQNGIYWPVVVRYIVWMFVRINVFLKISVNARKRRVCNSAEPSVMCVSQMLVWKRGSHRHESVPLLYIMMPIWSVGPDQWEFLRKWQDGFYIRVEPYFTCGDPYFILLDPYFTRVDACFTCVVPYFIRLDPYFRVWIRILHALIWCGSVFYAFGSVFYTHWSGVNPYFTCMDPSFTRDDLV
jgi:hypothetical protein